jgi:3-hydroxybutyryl-CoA dehydrogenase
MGHGIAQVSARHGYNVCLYDIDLGIVERGLDRIRGNLNKGISLGKVTPEERENALDRITLSSELGMTVGSADFVIEAVSEQIDVKQQIFRHVEANAPAHALLASNTSSLSIARIAAAMRDPSRLIGLHFFNPVHIMTLVEVVCGPDTSDETRDLGLAFAHSLGKDPIVVRDSPGFASSRLGLVLGLEAMRMVEEGVAKPNDIDKAMELGYRHPMGPLKLTDLVGLDVRLNIAEYLFQALGSEAFRPPEILKAMVEAGKLGKKSGQGFYDWTEEGS